MVGPPQNAALVTHVVAAMIDLRVLCERPPSAGDWWMPWWWSAAWLPNVGEARVVAASQPASSHTSVRPARTNPPWGGAGRGQRDQRATGPAGPAAALLLRAEPSRVEPRPQPASAARSVAVSATCSAPTS